MEKLRNSSDCWSWSSVLQISNCSDRTQTTVAEASKQFDGLPLSTTGYVAITTILCASTLLATPGNLLVIWVVIKTPFLRSKAVNMLIVNLCIFDLLASCFDLPLIWIILQLRFNRVRNHRWICTWQLFIHTMSLSGQILSFVSVGYERYHTVSNPFDKEKVRKITHILVISCWLIAALIGMIKINFAADTVVYNYCIQHPHRTTHAGIVYVMLPFGALCFLLVAFFYGRIVWLVRKHCQNVNSTCRKAPTAHGNGTDVSNVSELPSIYGEVCVLDSKNRERGKRRIEAETAKKSFFVIISFLAFTLPYPLMVTVEKLFQLRNRPIFELQYFFNIMSLLSSGLNPLVYGLANRQFRNAFRKICHRYYRRYKSRDYL